MKTLHRGPLLKNSLTMSQETVSWNVTCSPTTTETSSEYNTTNKPVKFLINHLDYKQLAFPTKNFLQKQPLSLNRLVGTNVEIGPKAHLPCSIMEENICCPLPMSLPSTSLPSKQTEALLTLGSEPALLLVA